MIDMYLMQTIYDRGEYNIAAIKSPAGDHAPSVVS